MAKNTIVALFVLCLYAVCACSGDDRPAVQQSKTSDPQDKDSDSVAASETDSLSGGDTTGADADADTDTDADTDADTDSDTDADADTDTDADADTDTDSDTDADADTDTDADADTDTDVDTDADADTDTDADADTDTDTDADTDTVEIKEEICDTDGNCYCLRMAVIGTTASTSGQTDVSAFVDWLNNDSSCYVTIFEDEVELTESFLDEFDIIIFQYLSNEVGGQYWEFSAAEVAALKAWVEEGNGMVTLTGYNGIDRDREVAAINSLLEPVSGISYNADTYLNSNGGTCGEVVPLGEEADPCWCWGNTVPIYGWNPDHEISREISQVGVLYGYSINAPANATVVATQDAGPNATTQNAAVAMEVGKGKVFAWADEWVIYSTQWRDGDSEPGGKPDEYNICYDMDEAKYNNAENYFQIPQFWYNVINWVAPPNDCFIIDDPVIIVI